MNSDKVKVFVVKVYLSPDPDGYCFDSTCSIPTDPMFVDKSQIATIRYGLTILNKEHHGEFFYHLCEEVNDPTIVEHAVEAYLKFSEEKKKRDEMAKMEKEKKRKEKERLTAEKALANKKALYSKLKEELGE